VLQLLAFVGATTEMMEIVKRYRGERRRLFQLSQEAYVRSSLPSEPDRDRAERLCVDMISSYHNLS
jgi:hypothetical protein